MFVFMKPPVDPMMGPLTPFSVRTQNSSFQSLTVSLNQQPPTQNSLVISSWNPSSSALSLILRKYDIHFAFLAPQL